FGCVAGRRSRPQRRVRGAPAQCGAPDGPTIPAWMKPTLWVAGLYTSSQPPTSGWTTSRKLHWGRVANVVARPSVPDRSAAGRKVSTQKGRKAGSAGPPVAEKSRDARLLPSSATVALLGETAV